MTINLRHNKSTLDYLSILLVNLIFLMNLNSSLYAQIAVKDKKHTKWSKIQRQVEIANTFFETKIIVVVEKIEKVQEVAQKAHQVVNGVIKNVQMVNQIIKMEKDIVKQVQATIERLNEPLETELGTIDLAILDKWKHIQVLLAIGGQKDSIFELFKHTIADDALTMDDKGRLNIIRNIYQDVLKMKIALRIEIRRINRQILRYNRTRRELTTYKDFFLPN